MAKQSISTSDIRPQLLQPLSNREKSVILVFLAALLLGGWLPSRIIISTSPSLSHRVFFLVPAVRKKIEKDQYIVIRHRETTFVRQGLNPDHERIIKKVGCVPGEILTRDVTGNFFCNGFLLGTSLKQDSTGRDLPQFHFSGTIPEDSYFLAGSNPRSYDSKYFGFIHADDILFKALPLW